MSTTRPGRRARWSARPRARSAEERAFLQLGAGSGAVADHGCRGGRATGAAQDGRSGRPRQAARHRARSSGRLRACAEAGRFGDGDLAAILAHQQQAGGELILFPARSEDHSLQRSTRSWEGLGR